MFIRYPRETEKLQGYRHRNSVTPPQRKKTEEEQRITATAIIMEEEKNKEARDQRYCNYACCSPAASTAVDERQKVKMRSRLQ